MSSFAKKIFLAGGTFLVIIFLVRPAGRALAAAPVELVNPLAFININNPGELIAVVISGFAGLMGIITIAFTVFNGFKLVIATSEEAIVSAKKSLTWSVGGFIIALLSFTIISGASKFLGFTPSKVGLGTDILQSPLSGPTDPSSFISVMSFVMVNFLGILGFATILMIIYYGYRYVTSAGNEESVEAAKRGLKWAIIGLSVTLLSFTLITAVRQLLI